MSNYYEVLNVSTNASDIEIKQSFRKLSLKYHPDKDKSPQSKQAYDAIMEAYTTLEDKNKRILYDKQFVEKKEVQNINQALVSIDQQPMVINKPALLTATICISLEQAFGGCQYPVEVERHIYEDGFKIKEKERIYVSVAAGTDNGEIIYIKHKGHESITGDFGDIKVYITVEEHPVFRRNGLDLYMDKSLTFEESLCGFTFHIPLLSGRSLGLRNNIGDVVLNGTTKIIRNKGMVRNNITGNLIINFTVVQPSRLNESLALAIKDLIVKNT